MSEEFECEVCGRTFDTERGMKVHASQVHKDEKKTDKKKTSGGTEDMDVQFEVSPWKMVSGVLGILLIVSLFFAVQGLSGTATVENEIPKEDAAEIAMNFVNEYMLEPEMEELEAEEVNEKYGLYEVVIMTEGMMGPQEHELYITKDGEIFFPESIDIEEFEQMMEEQQQMMEEMEGQEGGEIVVDPEEESEDEEIVIEPEEVEE